MHENGNAYNIITRPCEGKTEIKKSVFIAELATVKSEDEARAFLEDVKKRHREANHHCFSIRIGEPGSEYERFSDDGEPQGTAGKPILSLLRGKDLYDVCGVVTRYFGGTLLGTGGLVRAYSDAMKEALQLSEISELYKGIRVRLSCDYQLSNKVKYLADLSEIYTEKEEYTDKCDLFYLIEDEKYETFIRKVTEMSGGRVLPQEEVPLYFYKDRKPVVYKLLPR